jgi:hypothetical protein
VNALRLRASREAPVSKALPTFRAGGETASAIESQFVVATEITRGYNPGVTFGVPVRRLCCAC